MSALRAWAPAGHVYAWWVDNTLWIGSQLGDLVAAERSGTRWRLYDDMSDEQIGVIDGRADKAAVIKIVETLWSTTLRVTEVRAGKLGRLGRAGPGRGSQGRRRLLSWPRRPRFYEALR